jgi:glycosyltransferase involved in cell wall biosynthesis
VAEGETGFTVPYGDVAVLAARLARLLEDEDLRDRMGRAARSRMERGFDYARMIDEILEIYEIARAGAGAPGNREVE